MRLMRGCARAIKIRSSSRWLAINPLLAVLPRAGFIWLLTGGILYSPEIVLYAYDHRYPWMHGAWHLFVLAGSISHYVAILIYV